MTTVFGDIRAHWTGYWDQKSTPQHAGETPADFDDMAGEMGLLLTGVPFGRVVEIGCGNGALFDRLGFSAAGDYIGVDFSATMLDEFAARFPRARLVLADGATYRDTRDADLVFSSHVAQYWDRAQFAEHVRNAADMIGPDGAVVVAGIPWARMRWAFARGDIAGGELTGGGRRTLSRTLREWLVERIVPDIGQWYDLDDVRSIAAQHGLRASVRGSGYYPYRFHAVLRRHAGARGAGSR